MAQNITVSLSDEEYGQLETYAHQTARSLAGTLRYALSVLRKHEPIERPNTPPNSNKSPLSEETE